MTPDELWIYVTMCWYTGYFWGLFTIWHRFWHWNVQFLSFLSLYKEEKSSFLSETQKPTLQFSIPYSISNPLSSTIIHVAAALILAISLGAIFCPSNVYRENVTLSKPSTQRSYNGISAARQSCSAIHAKHVCLFPSPYTTKELVSSMRKVLNSSALHYGSTDTAAGSGSAMQDAALTSHKARVPP